MNEIPGLHLITSYFYRLNYHYILVNNVDSVAVDMNCSLVVVSALDCQSFPAVVPSYPPFPSHHNTAVLEASSCSVSSATASCIAVVAMVVGTSCMVGAGEEACSVAEVNKNNIPY